MSTSLVKYCKFVMSNMQGKRIGLSAGKVVFIVDSVLEGGMR